MQTHTGGCHCGAVRFTAEAEIENVISCNCSHCAKKGFLLTFIPETQFTLEKGADNLAEYTFNKRAIRHLFCTTCGTQAFAHATNQEGVPTVALNVRCLDDVDIEKLTITPVDGKNF